MIVISIKSISVEFGLSLLCSALFMHFYPVFSETYNQDSLNSYILSDFQVNPECNDAQIIK